MLSMLDSWNKRVLFIVHILIRMHIGLVQSFFDTGHVSIHFELVFDVNLLVQHLLIGKLVVFLILCMRVIKKSVLFSLCHGLLFIEFKGVIHLFK